MMLYVGRFALVAGGGCWFALFVVEMKGDDIDADSRK